MCGQHNLNIVLSGFIPSRLHLHIFVISSSYFDVLKRTPASIPRRRLDLLLNATWY